MNKAFSYLFHNTYSVPNLNIDTLIRFENASFLLAIELNASNKAMLLLA